MTPPDSELLDLFNKVADGVQSEADEAALGDALGTSPNVRRAYLDFMGLHAALEWEYAMAATTRPPVSPGNDGNCGGPGGASRAAAIVWWLAMAAGVAGMAVMIAAWPWAAGGGREGRPLAEVTGTRFVVPAEGQPPISVGQRLDAGPIEIVGGAVEITLRNGVKIVLQGPGRLVLEDEMRAMLGGGAATVRVPKGMSGFHLRTATTDVLDLGTEFAVRVTGLATDVQVFDGAVIATSLTGDGYPKRLEAREAIRFLPDEAGGSTPIPYSEDRFVRSLAELEAAGVRIERDERSVGKVFGSGQMARRLGRPTIDAIEVTRAPATVTVDGRLDEWPVEPGFRSALRGGDDDAEWVEGSMMYDARRLYVAARVGDPLPMRNVIDPEVDADRAWGGGSVQLRLSTDRTQGWPAEGNAATFFVERHVEPTPAELEMAANQRLCHLTLWYHAPTRRPCLAVSHGMTFGTRSAEPDEFSAAIVPAEDGRGYVLEYAIPWQLVNAADDPPRAGDVLAAAWQVFWGDASGRVWREQLVEVRNLAEPPRVWVWERAANWGRAEYR